MKDNHYLKMRNNDRYFVFEKLYESCFTITIYKRPTGTRLLRIYHTTGDCFVCGAEVYWSLLSLVHKLQNIGFERIIYLEKT